MVVFGYSALGGSGGGQSSQPPAFSKEELVLRKAQTALVVGMLAGGCHACVMTFLWNEWRPAWGLYEHVCLGFLTASALLIGASCAFASRKGLNGLRWCLLTTLGSCLICITCSIAFGVWLTVESSGKKVDFGQGCLTSDLQAVCEKSFKQVSSLVPLLVTGFTGTVSYIAYRLVALFRLSRPGADDNGLPPGWDEQPLELAPDSSDDESGALHYAEELKARKNSSGRIDKSLWSKVRKSRDRLRRGNPPSAQTQ